MLPFTLPIEITDTDFLKLTEEVHSILKDDITYPRKVRANNFYKRTSPYIKSVVDTVIAQCLPTKRYTWYYEIFYSKEPTGLHNDRNVFIQQNERCDLGLIIPIHWTNKTPETLFYDIFIEEKVNWNGKNFVTLDKKVVDSNLELLENPQGLVWQKKNALFFDSRQIHQAAPFTSSLSDYKLSINGLGYSAL